MTGLRTARRHPTRPRPTARPPTTRGFAVRLDNFEGPFDLLLGLIAKHKLDVTEVSLSKVTDEFIAYIRAQGPDWDLGVATEFLVVAATLLDLKAARLLPAAEVEDEEDLALLEARDLLFARLLQYRAYKQIAAIFDERWANEGRRYPRDVPLEDRYTGLLPEIVIKMDLDKFARLAARAMAPKSPKLVSIEHIHVQRVSVREQSAIVVERLRRHGALTFRALTADCPDKLHVIARFLCLLELFREAAVGFDQVEALGELHVRWTGGDTDALQVGAEFDELDEADGADADDEPAGPAPGDVVTAADILAMADGAAHERGRRAGRARRGGRGRRGGRAGRGGAGMTDDGFWIEPPDEPPAAPETPAAGPGAEPGAGTGATAAPDTAAGLPPQREAAPGTAPGDHERDAVAAGADAAGSDPTGAEGEERAHPEHVPEGTDPDRHAQPRLRHPGAPGAAAVAPTVPGPASGAAPALTVPAPAAEPGPGTEPVAADPTGNARPERSHPAAESATAAAPTVPAPATEPSPMPEPAAADPGSDADADASPYPFGDPDHLKPQLEAVLMVVESPVPDIVLAQVLEQPTEAVLAALRELAQEYTDQGRGFDLRQVAGGWRFYTRPEHAEAVEKFVLDGQQSKLTQAALETLAVVAYRQPVSRSRISAVRGVNCDGVMRTLLARGLVEEYGVEPETGAFLYRTTDFFLERMGLVSLDELPELAPFLPEVEALEAETEGGLDSFPVRSSGPVAAGGGGTGDTGGEDPAAADAEEPTDGAPADPAPAAPDPTDTGSASVPEAVPAPDEETGQTTTDD
ncbi:SMC-Scp complex subunit ScpB [Yinghuangia aomiensis]